RQRITFSYTLEPLCHQELSAYLDHRLRVAGFQGKSPFSPAVVKLLFKSSQGVPRMVNLLAHKTLLVAYGKGVRKINRKMVLAAIKDTSGLQLSRQKFFPAYAFEFSIVIIIAVMTLLAWGGMR
ncbi:MAG: AAA family ATPase, partial [Desulfuromusa sp.]|nr:AAA family ATPase [Desulfuromusa sp.]